jgi:hypothetical protein
MKSHAQILVPRRLAIIALALALMSPGIAGATQSLTSNQACGESTLYLEPVIDKTKDPVVCDNCRKEALEFMNLHDLAAQTAKITDVNFPMNSLYNQAPLSQACFVDSMKMRPQGPAFNYTSCKSDGDVAKSEIQKSPPCVTEGLANSVQQALQGTMSCLGVDQKEVFSLFGWESHYQVNLYNSGGIGVGQLTSIAVADIDLNRRFSEDLQNNRPACQQYSGIFYKSGRSYENLKKRHGTYPRTHPCEWMGPPDNPARNLLYAGAVYRMDKRVALPLANQIASSPKDAADIATQLAQFMYNGGAGGVRNVFRLFMLRRKADPNKPVKMNAKDFQTEFRAYLDTHYGDEGDLKEKKSLVSNYVKHVEAHTRSVNRDLLPKGISCSD